MNSKNNIPEITISIDAERDVDRFILFLGDQQYRRKRPAILHFYTKLAEKIARGEDEKDAVRDVVSDIYRRHGAQLKEIVTRAQKELSESEPVFAALSNYMDFPGLGEKTYSVMPTLLPFSPLGDQEFFFSVAPAIAGREIPPLKIIAIGVHEISHFIFFEQLRDWLKGTGNFLNDAATHYFKEALAPAVMNQKEFLDIFDYEKLFPNSNSLGKYRGNGEVRNLMIEKNGIVKNIVDYFEKEIVHSPDGYRVGLSRMLQSFTQNNDAFAVKWNLWNEIKAEQKEGDAIMEDYKKPVLL